MLLECFLGITIYEGADNNCTSEMEIWHSHIIVIAKRRQLWLGHVAG